MKHIQPVAALFKDVQANHPDATVEQIVEAVLIDTAARFTELAGIFGEVPPSFSPFVRDPDNRLLESADLYAALCGRYGEMYNVAETNVKAVKRRQTESN
jgi:hypothetical protein